MTTHLHRALAHAVTEFDNRQAAKAAKNPRAYYNAYALPQYLGRVADVLADIESGADVSEAIVRGFTPGPLRTAVLKAAGLAADNREAGVYSGDGMPVYRPASAG